MMLNKRNLLINIDSRIAKFFKSSKIGSRLDQNLFNLYCLQWKKQSLTKKEAFFCDKKMNEIEFK